MRGRSIAAGDPAYDGLFASIERSWFRLETLQHYSSGDGDLVQLVATGQPLPRQDGPWYEMLRAHTAAGRVLRRVHVVQEPHSAYVTYELAAYRDTTAAGEDVRIIPTPAETWPVGLPRQDFWVLDDYHVWAMSYDRFGAFERADLVSDPAEIAQHREWAETAWQTAVPLAAYVGGAELHRAI